MPEAVLIMINSLI